MDWIFDNIVIIAIIGSAIARWLSGLKDDSEPPPPHQDRPGRKKIDVDQLERNRRLREEIRRKREQRQRENAPPEEPQYEREVTPQLPPVLREMMGIPEEPAPVRPAPQAPPPVPKSNPVLERQQRMEQEMVALEKKRREAQALARKAGVGQNKGRAQRRKRSAATGSADLNEGDFLTTLRNPRQARRAILLREILGKPVGLR